MPYRKKRPGYTVRLVCVDCGAKIGRKNRNHLCLSCTEERRRNPKVQFEARVQVVKVDGRKVLVG